MIINTIRNIHFTRLVKANGRLREFNFRKANGEIAGIFHVDVSDDRGNRHMFKMEKESNNHWAIIDQPLPGWVKDSEKHLHELIEEELHQSV
jgi:hypothetical protein